jgi:hypothetical protein
MVWSDSESVISREDCPLLARINVVGPIGSHYHNKFTVV